MSCPNDLFNYGIKRLLTAIVLRACEDYMLGLRKGYPDPFTETINMKEVNKWSDQWYMIDAYRFLTSEDLQFYTEYGGRLIIKSLRERAKEKTLLCSAKLK